MLKRETIEMLDRASENWWRIILATIGEGDLRFAHMSLQTLQSGTTPEQQRTHLDELRREADLRGCEVQIDGGIIWIAKAHEVDALSQPFCACGRVVSQCDGSRKGCGK